MKPHSLSYQAITLTSVPSTTRVRSRSTTAARGYAKNLENAALSNEDKILAAALATVG